MAMEQDYARRLMPVVLACHEAMKRVVIPALPLYLPLGRDRMDAITADLSSLGSAGIKSVLDLLNRDAIQNMLVAKADELDLFQYGQLKRRLAGTVVKSLTGGLLAPADSKRVVNQFVTENVALIESIPTDYFKSIEGKVRAAAQAGTRVETLAADLLGTYGVAQSKANLIARDQIGKLYGNLNQARQQGVGVTTYIWRTMRDSRVRDTHEELEGRVYDWKSPPVTNAQGDRNHPGGDYQCRCTAEPNLAEIELEPA